MSSLLEVGDVEEDAAVRAAAALGDLGVVGERHPVARRQLEPLRVVSLHEPLAVGIQEPPALAPNCFCHERAGRLLGKDHPRRMELHELHVLHRAAGPKGERRCRRRSSRRGGKSCAATAACGRHRKHDGVCEEHGAFPAVDVECECAETGVVRAQEVGDVGVLDDVGNADGGGPPVQRPKDGPAGVVPGVAGTPLAVGAEEPLVDAAVVVLAN